MRTKRIISVLLTLAMLLTLSVSAFAAQTSTKTITFNSYATDDINFKDLTATLSVTNVVSQEKKDFSTYLSDDKVTISGKNSTIITCKAPVTVTLQPNTGEKNTGYAYIGVFWDSNINPMETVKSNMKYYVLNTVGKLEFDYSKKLNTAPKEGYYGVADGSSMNITKAGTYVLTVGHVTGLNDSDIPKNFVFIVVEGNASDAQEIKATSVTLSKTTAALTKGKTVTLIATVKPANATNKAVTWTSSNTKVATVDAKGKVTAKSKGTATVTCKTVDGKTATCKVTVK